MAKENMYSYYVFAMKAFADVLGTIAVPALVAVGVKYFLHLSTPVFIAVLLFAFVITGIALFRKIKAYGRAFQQLDEQDELRGPRG